MKGSTLRLIPRIENGFTSFKQPNHRNYTEALDLLALGGAHVVHSSEDLARVIQDAFNGVSSDVRGDIKTYVQDTCPKEDIIRKYVTELRTLDHQNR